MDFYNLGRCFFTQEERAKLWYPTQHTILTEITFMQWHYVFQVWSGTLESPSGTSSRWVSCSDMSLQRPIWCWAKLQGLSWILPGCTFSPNHPMPLTCCPPHCNCISLEQSSPLRQVFKDPEKKSSLVKSTAAVGLTKGFQLLKAMGPEAHAMALTI